MGYVRNLKNLLYKSVNGARDGDTILIGSFTRVLTPLEEALELWNCEHHLNMTKEPLHETRTGYLRIDRSGRVTYNPMQNAGLFGPITRFFRSFGLLGPETDWDERVKEFNYNYAFKVARYKVKLRRTTMNVYKLIPVNGNLYEFFTSGEGTPIIDENLTNLEEFLKIGGDFAPEGHVRVRRVFSNQ